MPLPTLGASTGAVRLIQVVITMTTIAMDASGQKNTDVVCWNDPD
jgi:hypothetical protein